MKRKLSLFAVLFLLLACNRNQDIPEPKPEPTVFTYVFNSRYKISEIISYEGPTGKKKELQEKDLKEYWEWALNKPENDTIIINTEKDSLFFKKKSSSDNYKMTMRNDSIFITNKNDYTSFFGLLDKNKKSISQYKYYYVRRFMPRPEEGIYGAYKFHKGSRFGESTYKNHFFENSFKSPSDMNKEGDLILWANYQFEFAFLKEE